MTKKVDWSYHRNGCNTCGKTVAFLAEHEVAVELQVNAKKEVLADPEALALLNQVDELYATKGTKVFHINLKQERPDDATLLNLVIGPSGKLRAPTLKKGRTLIVGFDEATYQKVFG
ncbi:MAG: ArsC family protein [Planctomycetaceae bacterium]|nr:ArsC family protein [Planctomycetaceae bacterium]